MAISVGQEIAQAQEAIVRNPVQVAGSVEAQMIQSLRDKSAEDGLKLAAGKEPDFPVMKKLSDQNIGYKDQQGQQQRNNREQQLKQNADTLIDSYEAYLQTADWNQIPQATRAALINAVGDGILNDPGMASRFSQMNAAAARAEADRVAEEYLRDGSFKGQVKALLLARADATKPMEDKVTGAKTAMDKAVAERARLQALKQQQDQDVAAKQAQVNQYTEYEDPNNLGQNPPVLLQGARYQELGQQQGTYNAQEAIRLNIEQVRIPTENLQIQNLEGELAIASNPQLLQQMQAQNQPLPRNPNLILQDIQQARQRLVQAQQDMAQAIQRRETAKSRVEQIKADQTKFETELKQLKTDKQKIDKDSAESQQEENKQTAEFNKLLAEKVLQEEQWVVSLDTILVNVTSERVKDELATGRLKVKELTTKQASEEKDGNKKRVLEVIADRYIDARGRAIRATLDPDYVALMGNTADTVVGPAGETMLLNGAEQALFRILQADPQLTPQQRYDLLQDKTFREEMSSRIAKEILTCKLYAGDKMSSGEIIRIQKSTWGLGMVAQAIEGNAALHKAIEDVAGKGILDSKSSLSEQLKNMDWNKFLLILLVILGVIGGAGIVTSL